VATELAVFRPVKIAACEDKFAFGGQCRTVPRPNEMSYMRRFLKDLLCTDFKFAINFGETNICPLVAFV
jgi:hypothetical protein